MEFYWSAWRNALNFRGRARRMEYWVFYMVNGLLILPLVLFGNIAAELKLGNTEIILAVVNVGSLIWNLTTLIPSVSVSVRRFHDVGISAKWLLFVYASLIAIPALMFWGGVDETTWLTGLAVMLMFGLATFIVPLLPGQPHDNDWGPNPKAPQQVVEEQATA